MHAAIANIPARAVPLPHVTAPGAEDHDRLIEAVARHRDREAFAALFDHFAPRLKAYLMKAGASAGVAEDFAQDTLLTVWRKADLFDARRASAATWIFTIARNRRIDALRREARPAPLPDVSLEPDPIKQPDELVVGGEDFIRVSRALRRLSADQAEVIRLSFFQDCAHAEIAKTLNLPLGTVKSRIRTALIKLRDLLAGDSHD